MRKDAMTIKSSGLDLSIKQELPRLRDFLDFFPIWQGASSMPGAFLPFSELERYAFSSLASRLRIT